MDRSQQRIAIALAVSAALHLGGLLLPQDAPRPPSGRVALLDARLRRQPAAPSPVAATPLTAPSRHAPLPRPAVAEPPAPPPVPTAPEPVPEPVPQAVAEPRLSVAEASEPLAQLMAPDSLLWQGWPGYLPSSELDHATAPQSDPDLSALERADGEARVEVKVYINEAGGVDGVELVSSQPAGRYDDAVRAAFAALRFEPGLRRGRPVRYFKRIVVGVTQQAEPAFTE